MRTSALLLLSMIVTHSINGGFFSEILDFFGCNQESPEKKQLADWNYALLYRPLLAQQMNDQKSGEYFIQLLTANHAPMRVDHAIKIAAFKRYNALLNLLLDIKNQIHQLGDDYPAAWECDPTQLELALLLSCQVKNQDGAYLLLKKTTIQGTAQTKGGLTALHAARLHGLLDIVYELEKRQFELKPIHMNNAGELS